MRAVEYDQYGASDVLVVRDVPTPEPGVGELLVRVHAAALNPKDLFVRKGRFRIITGRRFPKRLGYDWAGTVEALGRGVGRLAVGDRVFGMIQRWSAGACAELAVVKADECSRAPSTLAVEEAAAMPLAALTALQALRDVARVKEGDRVLVNGASGGVGVYAVQMAKSLGAQVTTTSSARNFGLCRCLGADETVDYAAEDVLAGERRFDVVFDVFGNRRFDEARRALKSRGTYVTTVPSRRIAVDTARTLLAPQRARLVVVQSRARDLETLTALAEAGKLRPVIDRVYPLEEVREACDFLATKRARGKVVLRID